MINWYYTYDFSSGLQELNLVLFMDNNQQNYLSQVGDAWSLLSAVVFGIHLFRTEFHSRDLSADAAFPIIALQVL